MAASGITVASAASGQEVAFDKYGDASPPTTDQRVQWIGLATGTTGALAPATLSNPVPVGAALDWIQITPTLDTSIYASGDLLFDVATITSAATATGRQTELVSVMVTDEDEQNTAIDLYITNLSTTWGTFNDAVAATDALSRGLQAYIPIAAADFKDVGGAGVAQPATAQNIGVVCETSGSANLYLVGICRSGTPTYTANGLRINLGFRRT